MHSKVILSGILAALFGVSPVYAEDGKAVISLTDGIVISKSDKAQSITEEALQNKENENADNQKDGSFFNLFNFSFFSKDKSLSSPTKNETQEEFLARMQQNAEQGNVDALLTLGYMYLYGLNGVEMNYKKSFEYYSLAAQQGDSTAINNLGSMYYSGTGIAKNVIKAAELFAKAGNAGNIDAKLNLALIYLNDDNVELKNSDEAIKLLKATAEKDHPVGKYLLGYAYLKGISVPKNNRKAVENIRFAADKGYDEAQYMIGYLYERGWGVPQNYNNALKYYNRSASQGNLSAIFMLGELYAHGQKIEVDYYKAYIMYNLASFYGMSKAEGKRDIIGSAKLKKPDLLQAQAEAENFTPRPSELTQYVRTVFGKSLALYADKSAPIILGEEE